jgi:hypothetical protein
VVELAGGLLDGGGNGLCLSGRCVLAGVEFAVDAVDGRASDLLRVAAQFVDGSAGALGCRLLHKLPFLLDFKCQANGCQPAAVPRSRPRFDRPLQGSDACQQ